MPDQPNDLERLVAVIHHHRQFSTDADLVRALLQELQVMSCGMQNWQPMIDHIIRQGEPNVRHD